MKGNFEDLLSKKHAAIILIATQKIFNVVTFVCFLPLCIRYFPRCSFLLLIIFVTTAILTISIMFEPIKRIIKVYVCASALLFLFIFSTAFEIIFDRNLYKDSYVTKATIIEIKNYKNGAISYVFYDCDNKKWNGSFTSNYHTRDLFVGGTILILFSKSRPQINRLYNMQPTLEDLTKYWKGPIRYFKSEYSNHYYITYSVTEKKDSIIRYSFYDLEGKLYEGQRIDTIPQRWRDTILVYFIDSVPQMNNVYMRSPNQEDLAKYRNGPVKAIKYNDE